MDDVLVACQRCGAPGGKVHRGWTLLCSGCRAEDDAEWFDRGCRDCGHPISVHGDRAISACIARVPIENSYRSDLACSCRGWA